MYAIRSYYASARIKAKVDCEIIFERAGVKNIGLPLRTKKNKIFSFFYTLLSVTLGAVRLPFDSFLVLQYPVITSYSIHYTKLYD